MKTITLIILSIYISGCGESSISDEEKYKNFPKVCTDYLKQYDGYLLGGHTSRSIYEVMNYCKYREELKDEQ